MKAVHTHSVQTTVKRLGFAALSGALFLCSVNDASARDVEYKNSEVAVYINPNEPTQLQFPAPVAGGFKKKGSALSLDKRETDLIVFGNERLADTGEAIIVRLNDGRSYSVRVHKASADKVRDDVVRIEDGTGSVVSAEEEESGNPAVAPKYDKAPPTHVAGLMREMMLAAEFGKNSIPGYRISDRYKGQAVLTDGTVEARIDRIFIGPNLWGYVVDTRNLLDQTQKLNPASFRLDGTRAVSAQNWELAPRPLNIEEQISRGHTSKVYIVTRSR